MDFSWTAEQQALQASTREFGEKSLGQFDGSGSGLPGDGWRACADFGILGLCVSPEWGGSGLDVLSAAGALEALGEVCRDNGLLFGLNAQMWAVQAPIERFCSEAQKARYLPSLVDGTLIGAHGMTEPGSGSDTFALRTTARSDRGHYVLNGQKTFVSNAPDADLFLVFAATHPGRGFFGVSAFLLERDTPGLSVGRAIPKMGLHSAPMAEVFLADCRVPEEQRIGREGNGGSIFRHAMLLERCCILATNLGTMQRQLNRVTEHARTREQFGRPISDFQAVSHRIADMSVRLDSARLLLYRAAWTVAAGLPAEAEVATAKLAVSEAFVHSSLDAIQIFGGYGYSTEYGLEQDLRDAVGGRIYSGTSEIQHEIIAKALGL